MITEINHEAVAMAQRMKASTLTGDVDQQFHWAAEILKDAEMRGGMEPAEREKQ